MNVSSWYLSFIILILSSVLSCIDGLTFRVQLPHSARRCYFQDVLANTLLVVSASPSSVTDKVDLSVSFAGEVIYHGRDEPKMKTAFTSVHSGLYSACIMNFGATTSTVTFSIEQGPELKDYTQIAKKEHLDPLIVNLRRVEDQLRDYHRNLLYMRSRELKLRKANESISSRVLMFCFITISVTLVATFVQILYFRSFLRSKKII